MFDHYVLILRMPGFFDKNLPGTLKINKKLLDFKILKFFLYLLDMLDICRTARLLGCANRFFLIFMYLGFFGYIFCVF